MAGQVSSLSALPTPPLACVDGVPSPNKLPPPPPVPPSHLLVCGRHGEREVQESLDCGEHHRLCGEIAEERVMFRR